MNKLLDVPTQELAERTVLPTEQLSFTQFMNESTFDISNKFVENQNRLIEAELIILVSR